MKHCCPGPSASQRPGPCRLRAGIAGAEPGFLSACSRSQSCCKCPKGVTGNRVRDASGWAWVIRWISGGPSRRATCLKQTERSWLWPQSESSQPGLCPLPLTGLQIPALAQRVPCDCVDGAWLPWAELQNSPRARERHQPHAAESGSGPSALAPDSHNCPCILHQGDPCSSATQLSPGGFPR